jgi:hypothetical protein
VPGWSDPVVGMPIRSWEVAVVTRRFSLSQFGGSVGGSIIDDGAKYSTSDRAVIDAVLAAFETHSHTEIRTGGTRIADPTEAPRLDLAITGGNLPGNITYYYQCSFIDTFGLETAASSEVSVATGEPVLAPNLPILSGATGGTLADGLYLYGLTSLTAAGAESELGSVASITVIPGDHTVIVGFPPLPAGAATFGVWRQGPQTTAPTRIVIVDPAATDSFTDTGAIAADPLAGTPGHLPPTMNLTNASNAVTITCPDAGLVAAAGTGIAAWRIYRSTSSGVYPAASLLAEIVGPGAGGIGLVATFVDDGTAVPTQGGPLFHTQTLQPAASVLRTVTTLPTPAPPTPTGVLHLVSSPGQFALYLTDGAAWHTVGGSSGVFAPASRLIVSVATPPAATGAGAPLTVTGDPLDTVGNDTTVLPFADGPLAQLTTAGTWAVSVTAGPWPVTDPGDTLLLMVHAALPDGAADIIPDAAGQVTAVAGQSAITVTTALPTRRYPAGTRLTGLITSYYTTDTPALIPITLSAALVAGTAADAVLTPATSLILTRADASATVAFTFAPGADRHELRLYAGVTFVDAIPAAISGQLLTGLTNGTEYTVQVYAVHAGAYAAPATGVVTPTAPTVPDPPRLPLASGGNAMATISFTPPSYDGGSSITGYTVTSDPDGLAATGAESPIIVTGLTNGTAYTFTVTATNAQGESAPSIPTDPIMPAGT